MMAAANSSPGKFECRALSCGPGGSPGIAVYGAWQSGLWLTTWKFLPCSVDVARLGGLPVQPVVDVVERAWL